MNRIQFKTSVEKQRQGKPRVLFILGTGGFGREVLWAAREDVRHESDLGWRQYIFLDEFSEQHGKNICGVKVEGGPDSIPKICSRFRNFDFDMICGIGSPAIREKLVNLVSGYGFVSFVSLVHKSVSMSDYVTVGEGSVICAGNIITTQVLIGNHVNLNIDCTVGHDVVIEDYVNVSPGCHLSGHVTLKKGCDLGTGVNVVPGVTIGEGAVIGAGATVTKDIPSNVLAVGVPARVLDGRVADIASAKSGAKAKRDARTGGVHVPEVGELAEPPKKRARKKSQSLSSFTEAVKKAVNKRAGKKKAAPKTRRSRR